MSKKLFLLSSLVFSLFFISSCHYMGKKSCCGKKSWSKKGKHRYGKKWFKKRKSCCGKTSVAGQAIVTAVKGEKITGEVFFEQADWGKIQVTGNFKGLPSNKKFGFHVHEFGKCGNQALMAGGHFNPWKQKHGGPESKERHLGDLGNLNSDKDGQAVYSAVIPGRLKKFLGRSIIVHAKPDDLKSQPTGNAGNRIACGVIVATMPPVTEKEEKDSAEETTHKASAQKAPAMASPEETHKASAQKVPAMASPETHKASTQKAPAKTSPETHKASTQKAPAKTSPETHKASTTQ